MKPTNKRCLGNVKFHDFPPFFYFQWLFFRPGKPFFIFPLFLTVGTLSSTCYRRQVAAPADFLWPLFSLLTILEAFKAGLIQTLLFANHSNEIFHNVFTGVVMKATLLNLGLRRILAHGTENVTELSSRDFPITLTVKQLESLLAVWNNKHKIYNQKEMVKAATFLLYIKLSYQLSPNNDRQTSFHSLSKSAELSNIAFIVGKTKILYWGGGSPGLLAFSHWPF